MKLFMCLLLCLGGLAYGQKQLKQSFYFETGSATLNDQQVKRLQVLVKKTKAKHSELYLFGFTDEQGSNSSNMVLAKKRVKAISNAMGSSSFKDMKEEYLGEDSLTHNVDSLNRRVDVMILDYSALFERKSMRLKNCLFVPGKYEFLNEEAENSVKRLAEILNENPEFRIMIEGHVCCGPDQTLSNNRAIRVLNYLVDLGISRERMEWKGFSNTRPLAKEVTAIARKMNRRVEVRLID